MPTASARRLMLSSSRGVRLKLSCCDLGSDFRGRAIIFLPWQSASVLGFGGHPLAGPQRVSVCPRQTDISLPSPPNLFFFSLTSIVTICTSQTLQLLTLPYK